MTNFKQDQSTTAVCGEVTSLEARHGGHCGTRVRWGFLPLALHLAHLFQRRRQLREAGAWLARLLSLWPVHHVQ